MSACSEPRSNSSSRRTAEDVEGNAGSAVERPMDLTMVTVHVLAVDDVAATAAGYWCVLAAVIAAAGRLALHNANLKLAGFVVAVFATDRTPPPSFDCSSVRGPLHCCCCCWCCCCSRCSSGLS